jgi:ribosomal protein S14
MGYEGDWECEELVYTFLGPGPAKDYHRCLRCGDPVTGVVTWVNAAGDGEVYLGHPLCRACYRYIRRHGQRWVEPVAWG